ncbi:hypothetical protein FHT86_001380 [Rhizobium sp. BK313]|uniref:hypothetical protein n=1 Tax=Rhizobium sp. BK313 TaxID=2587081 RepID=UPI00105F8334|nr:hypothetical protein [Rhizobium sp. BK313]MBB3453124.1 hypothetical protein [Rhizobium sp. BK313]
MDKRVFRYVRLAGAVSKESFAEDLGRMLADFAGGSLGVRQARDGFAAVLRLAREGRPQIIGSAEDGVIVISVRDLAELLEVAREPTLGETLVSAGFKPYRSRINVEERRNNERLKRRE